MSWSIIKLGDISEVFSGFAFKASNLSSEGIPILKIANIQDKKVIRNCPTNWPENNLNGRLSRYILKKEDFLVAMTGAGSVGKVGKMRNIDRNYLVNQRVGVVRVNKDEADPDFIFYLMSQNKFESYMYGLGLGAGQPNISPTNIGNIEISVPSLGEQHKIASILSAYDDLIENNTRRIKILEEMAQAIYREWFVNFKFPGHEKVKFVDLPAGQAGSELGKIPEGWEVVRLKDIYKTSSGGTPSRKKSHYYENGIYNWIKTRELKDNFIFETEEKITKEALENSSAKLFPEGTVLIALYGATIGKLGILTKESTTNQACCAVIPCYDGFTYAYIYSHLYQKRNDIFELRAGAAQQNISQEIVKNLQILKPNLKLIESYNNNVLPLFDGIRNLLIKNSNLRKTRDLLLPKLMSGEIDVEELDIELNEG